MGRTSSRVSFEIEPAATSSRQRAFSLSKVRFRSWTNALALSEANAPNPRAFLALPVLDKHVLTLDRRAQS